MKNNAFKWLAVTLLLLVSVFCYLYLDKLPQQPSTPANTQAAENTDKPDATPDETPTQPEKPVYYNTLPRDASSVDGAAVQNVGGTENEVFRRAFTVGGNTILFFDSESNGYDLKSNGLPSVGAAILDENLTLLKTVVFDGTDARYFADVKLIGNTFLLATNSETYTTILKLDSQLITMGSLTLDKAQNVRLYYAGSVNYLFLEKEDSLQIRVISQTLEVTKSATVEIPSPKIIEIFPDGERLNIFTATADGFALLRYSEDGGFFAANRTIGESLISITPYSTNGRLCFAGLTSTSDGLAMFTADSALTQTTCVPVEADYARLFRVGENFSLYTRTGNAAQLKIYCDHLDNILNVDAPYMDEIIYSDYSSPLTIAAWLEASQSIQFYSFDGLAFTAFLGLVADKSCIDIMAGGAICFTSSKKSGVASQNFGQCDVFIMRAK